MNSEAAVWEVEVQSDIGDLALSTAPLKFGTPYLRAGSLGDGARVPLAYGPVELFSIDDAVVIRTTSYIEEEPNTSFPVLHSRAVPTDHRELFRPHWEAAWGGDLRISGFEERPDGTLVRALWLVRPFRDEVDV